MKWSYFLGSVMLTQAFDYDGGTQVVYLGEAKPGTAKDEAGWRIKKFTYSGTSVTDIQWADGDTRFNKKWSLRKGGTYSYS